MSPNEVESVKFIGKLIQELKGKQKKMAELEEETKLLKAQIKELQELTIPDVMSELGMQQVTLMTNEIVIIKPFYYARLPEDPSKFFTWLRDNEFGGLIKEKVEVVPDASLSQLLIDFLDKFNITYEQMSTIHWKTLEAWFKECCEAGVKLPLDLFLNHTGRKAIVKG